MNLVGYWHPNARLLEVDADPPFDSDAEIWGSALGGKEERLGSLARGQKSAFVRCHEGDLLAIRVRALGRPAFELSFDSAVKPASIFEGKLGDLSSVILRATAWVDGNSQAVTRKFPAETRPEAIKSFLKSALHDATWLEVEAVPIKDGRLGGCVRQWCRRRRQIAVTFELRQAAASSLAISLEAQDQKPFDGLHVRHLGRNSGGRWVTAKELALSGSGPSRTAELTDFSSGDFVALVASAPDFELKSTLVDGNGKRPHVDPCVAVFEKSLQPRLRREAEVIDEIPEILPDFAADLLRFGIEARRSRDLKTLVYRPGFLSRMTAEGTSELILDEPTSARLLELPSSFVENFLSARAAVDEAARRLLLGDRAGNCRSFAAYLENPQYFAELRQGPGGNLVTEAAQALKLLDALGTRLSPDQRAVLRVEIEETIDRGDWAATRRALAALAETARILTLRELQLEQGDTPLVRLLWIAPSLAPFPDLLAAAEESRDIQSLLHDGDRRKRVLDAFQRVSASSGRHALAWLRVDLLATFLARFNAFREAVDDAGLDPSLPYLDLRDLGAAKVALEAVERIHRQVDKQDAAMFALLETHGLLPRRAGEAAGARRSASSGAQRNSIADHRAEK
jgi:hypothetical protein